MRRTMRAGPLIPPVVFTSMMVVALFVVVTFENQVPSAAQQAIAAKEMPFMNMPTGGNLVLSFGAFLVVTLIADVVLFVPLYLSGRRGRYSS